LSKGRHCCFDIVAENGNNVAKTATMSKQHSTLSKETFDLLTMLLWLRRSCWCGRGYGLPIVFHGSRCHLFTGNDRNGHRRGMPFRRHREYSDCWQCWPIL